MVVGCNPPRHGPKVTFAAAHVPACPQDGSVKPRAAWHTVGAFIVAGYLLAAVAVVVARFAVPGLALPGLVPGWLPLHLLLLGAATNAVFIWSRHFAEALLHAPPDPVAAARLRLIVLNAGVIAVLAGVAAGLTPVAIAGAALVIAAIAAHTAALVAMMRAKTLLAGVLRIVAWYYVAAGVALAMGAIIGSLLAAGVSAHRTTLDAALMLAHAHLNLFGWLGLPIVGTEFMLWPTVLRTRMSEAAPRIARRVLILLVIGLAGTTVTLLAGAQVTGFGQTAARWLAAAGMAAFTGGVAWSLVPAVQEMRAAPPRSCAAWALLAGNSWLILGLAADTIALAAGLPFAHRLLERHLIPALGIGAVAQILVGALTYLLPVTIGGGPAGGKAMARVLDYAWPVRLIAVNAGVIGLAAAPPSSAWRLVAWVAVLVGLGTFPVLVAGALVTARVRAASSQ